MLRLLQPFYPPRQKLSLAGCLWAGSRAERASSRQLSGAPSAAMPLGPFYSGGWRVWPFKGARAGAVTADRVKAKGRLGNGVRAAPWVRRRRGPVTAPGVQLAGPGVVAPSPEPPADACVSKAGRGPGPGHNLSPPPCMDLPNKFHLVISLRRGRAVSICFLTYI